MTTDMVVCKFGKYHDFKEIDTDCGYVANTLEPFLDLSVNKENGVRDERLEFVDDDGRKFVQSVSSIVNGGLKVYYHDSEQIDPNKLPGTRRAGLVDGLLEVIDIFVYNNKLT